MANISKEAIKEREDFVVGLFKSDLGLAIPKANDALNEKFGSRMRPKRMYELRKIARGNGSTEKSVRKPITAAARPSRTMPVRSERIKLQAKFTYDSADQARLLGDALADLRSAGLTDLETQVSGTEVIVYH